MRDEFLNSGTFDTLETSFKLACGIFAFEQVTAAHITASFENTGTFPLVLEFAEKFYSTNGLGGKEGL